MRSWDYDVAVVGAGPGGLVASLYLRRYLRSTLLISSRPPRASWIPRTYNVLGYRGGISGAELLARLSSQLDDLGIERAKDEVKVYTEGEGFRIVGSESLDVTAHKVVIATGITDVNPQLENLVQLRRRGLLRYCPVCDAFEFRGKRLAVLARDTHGLKTAQFLSRFSRRVTVLWPLEIEPPARPLEKVEGEGIHLLRANLELITERGLESGLTILARAHDGIERDLNVDAAYVALGAEVNDESFRHLDGLTFAEDGRLITGGHQETSVPGLFAVGDCVSGLAQITVAAGHAAIAATDIHRQLSASESVETEGRR